MAHRIAVSPLPTSTHPLRFPLHGLFAIILSVGHDVDNIVALFKEQEMRDPNNPAIGIDLGTTFSVLAYLDAHGEPKSVANAEGDLLTPSVVLFEDSLVTVGKEARKAAALVPEGLAAFAKRDMGEPAFHREISGSKFPPEVIQSLVLSKLKHDAELQLPRVEQAVITVPSYFNEPRRKATQDAGQLAGLDVLDIINEPTAAALTYGAKQGFLNERGEAAKTERVLVYDLGGGTFDVTLMEIEGKNYNTIATGGDVYLGGIDFDRRLIDHVAAAFQEKHGGDDPKQDLATLQRMTQEAEDVKRALTNREQTTFTVEHKGQGMRLQITRNLFESLTEDLLMRTMFTIRNVLRQANCEANQVTRVILVGGSTRMPMVARQLEKELGQTIDRSISTDEAVAHGAAIYAGILQNERAGIKSSVSVVNVNSHSLGVLGTEEATGRPRNAVIIPANSQLPLVMGKRFSTAKDGQRSIKVSVIEGGNASGQNATPVAQCVIRDLPPNLPKGTKVEVFFSYQQNGRMKIRARVPKLDKEATLVVQREVGLSDENMVAWQQWIDGTNLSLGD
ncbi:MAG: hypothetical protein CMJ78_12125 [Planctomycetaceae bacterium]|nr:hypothetical protein [Planctomycetaceae bacterium]